MKKTPVRKSVISQINNSPNRRKAQILKNMIYILTEWDGKGSGEQVLKTTDKNKAMSNRECTLTADAAKKKYGNRFFRASDVKCSSISSYSSEKALREGKPTSSNNWY